MRRLALTCAVLTLGFAPVPMPKSDSKATPESELKALEGEWVRTSLHINGGLNGERPGSCRPTIKDAVLAFGSPGDSWKLRIDLKGRPAKIDCRRVDGTMTFLGVYERKGERLTICWLETAEEAKRPTALDPKQPGVWVQVMERAKR